MKDALTTDEFEALAEVGRGLRSKRLSPRVTKHSKHLYGLKYITYGRSGFLVITDAGREALFIKSCIDGLRRIARDPMARLDADVINLLGKKGHIAPREEGGFMITTKGQESLESINALD